MVQALHTRLYMKIRLKLRIAGFVAQTQTQKTRLCSKVQVALRSASSFLGNERPGNLVPAGYFRSSQPAREADSVGRQSRVGHASVLRGKVSLAYRLSVARNASGQLVNSLTVSGFI